MSATETNTEQKSKLHRGKSPSRLKPSTPTEVQEVLYTLEEGPNETIQTAAEIITNKEMDEDTKKRLLLQQWGKKGGDARAKQQTKWKPEFVNVARKLATIGVPERDIAALFGVKPGTFSRWKRANASLRKALKEGDAQKRTNLIMQMQMSAGQGIFQMQMFLAKNWLGMTDRVDTRMSGGVDITYKSHIPQEKGQPGVDPESRKGKTAKLQDKNDK